MKEQILGMDKEMFSWMCTLIIVPVGILILSVIYFINEKKYNNKNKK